MWMVAKFVNEAEALKGCVWVCEPGMGLEL